MIDIRRVILPAAYIIGGLYCITAIIRLGLDMGWW